MFYDHLLTFKWPLEAKISEKIITLECDELVNSYLKSLEQLLITLYPYNSFQVICYHYTLICFTVRNQELLELLCQNFSFLTYIPQYPIQMISTFCCTTHKSLKTIGEIIHEIIWKYNRKKRKLIIYLRLLAPYNLNHFCGLRLALFRGRWL